jgi:CHAD domain-containing protein
MRDLPLQGLEDAVSTKIKTPPPINAEQTVSEAFVAILRHNREFIGLWEKVAREGEDIEGVHQLRVSFRRMRSALSLFRDAIPREATAAVADEMRWIAAELGPARDLDVFISEGLGAVSSMLPFNGEEALKALAEERRTHVYRNQVHKMLESERYRSFCRDFPDWLEARPWEQEPIKKKQAKRLHSSIVAYARQQLDKQKRRVLAAGSHVDRENSEEMHCLRIECKKLRYAAEFFRPIFDGIDGFISHMKGLQDLLGVLNDVSVTQNLLDDLLADTNDHEILVYAGGLIGWRTCHYRHMLLSFDDYWEELVEAKHHWWKKDAVIGASS